MKPLHLTLVLTLAPLAAQAGSLTCSAPGLSYEFGSPDGGAPIGPTITLVMNGKTLIDVKPFGRGQPSLARIEFDPKQTVLKTVKTPEYVTTTYECAATVTMNGETAPDFKGTVLCQDSRYVGPPRP
jgi:hypothetical protein